jgi:hypothetical protein
MPPPIDPTSCDTFCYTLLSLCTIGTICVALAVSIYFVWTLDLTAYDTSILVWLFVALAVAVSVLFVALYLNCCQWRFAKILLAVIYTIFDLFLLIAAISVFTFRSQVLEQLGGIWSSESGSSIGRYFEKEFDCCGFKTQPPEAKCPPNKRVCFDALGEQLKRYSGWIGGILIVLFFVLLVGVGIAFFRSCPRAEPADDFVKSQEMAQIQAQLNEGGNIWF